MKQTIAMIIMVVMAAAACTTKQATDSKSDSTTLNVSDPVRDTVSKDTTSIKK